VPAPEIVAIVSPPRRAGIAPEIVVVAAGPARVVVVISGGWPSPGLVPTPVGLVAVCVLCGAPIAVDVVASREDRSWDLVEESSRRVVTAGRAIRDVTGADERDAS
jgi:hypothetical protein